MDYDKYYEYIVIGCGGVGSGALFWLAKKVGKGKVVGGSQSYLIKLKPGFLLNFWNYFPQLVRLNIEKLRKLEFRVSDVLFNQRGKR